MPQSRTYDGITITAATLTADGSSWLCDVDYYWTATAVPSDRRERSKRVSLTAGQVTAINNFFAQKLAELKTADGI